MSKVDETAEEEFLIFFPKYFSNLAIRAYFLILVIIAAFSLTNISPLIWLFFCTFTVIIFFTYFYRLTLNWSKYSDGFFRKKLFKTALTIRLVSILLLYGFFYYMNGQPFEFDAGDAVFYDQVGRDLSDEILKGNLNVFEQLQKYMTISDTGFPIYLSFIYILTFKSLLIARLFNAFLGAWLCVVIYDFTKRNFNENVARIAGIMMMLLPALIYYSSLNLKETLMIFLTFSFLNLGDIILKSKHINYWQITFLVLTGTSLFLFRTVLAVCVLFSFFTFILFTSTKISGLKRKFIIGIWFCSALLFLLTTSVVEDVKVYIYESGSNQSQKLTSITGKEGNKFAKYGSKSLFFPILLAAPFPTFVDTGQKNMMMLGGSMFIRNIYAFFVILALIGLYKKKLLLKYVLPLSFLFSYLIVLGFSGFVLSDRFHLPIVPVFAILTAYGITELNRRNYKYFNLYLILIGFIVIGWNWFKLAGRDLF